MSVAMVVDDDEDIRMLFREVLQRGGFDLLMAANVEEAIVLLERYTPDIAFIDINLPERPGTDVLMHIHANPRLARTKTVVVTANSRTDNRAAELGADLFLVKPIAVTDILLMAQRLTSTQD